MKKIIVSVLVVLVAYSVFASDFSLGFSAGFNYTEPNRTKDWTDRKFSGKSDFSSAVITEWKVNDWFSLRSGVDLLVKAYKQEQPLLGCYTDYRDLYMDIPFLADFSFGSEKFRGHTYIGAYVGLWLCEGTKGKSQTMSDALSDEIYHKYDFDSEKDSRFNAGIAGGLGFSASVSKKISLMTDAMLYYDLTSSVKQYGTREEYRYNTSVAVRLGMTYSFGGR